MRGGSLPQRTSHADDGLSLAMMVGLSAQARRC